MTEWLQPVVTAIAALAGGIAGGYFVAYRFGHWRGEVDATLRAIHGRLEKGNGQIGDIPVIATRLETLTEEIRQLRKEMREDRREFVTHEECERTHNPDGR